MTLKDAIAEYCTQDFDFSSVLAKAEPLFDDKFKDKYRQFVQNVPDEIMGIRRIIKSTIANYSSMRRMVKNNDYHNSRMKTLFDDCRKRTEEIENIPAIEYVHVQLQGKSTELLGKVNKLESDEKQELLTVCDMGEQYLRDMDLAITELEPYLDMIRRDFGRESEK